MGVSNDLHNLTQKSDKIKMIVLVIAMGAVISIWQYSKNYIQVQEQENHKIKVVNNREDDGGGIIEFRDQFEYAPDFNDFFDIADASNEEEGVPAVTEGEIKIRNILGSIMYRAQPQLIQAKAMPAAYQTLVENGDPDKGQIFWVVGKVVAMQTLSGNDKILSAQFIYSFIIEDGMGGVYELQSLRQPKDVRVGDVVFMNGVFIKLSKSKEPAKLTPLILGNHVRILFPLPAVWDTVESYKAKVNALARANRNTLKLPEELAMFNFKENQTNDFAKVDYLGLQSWWRAYEETLSSNDKAWAVVSEGVKVDSAKLSPEIEKKIIADLSLVSNTTLLDMSISGAPINWNQVNIEQYQRKIIKVSGKLEEFVEVPLDVPIGGQEKVYYAKVRDLKGVEYYFNFLSPYFSDQQDREAWENKAALLPKEGDIVFCLGVYVQSVEVDKEKVPLLYGKYLADIGSYTAIFNSIDHGGKRIADNNFGDLRDAGLLEKMPYSYLLSKVAYTNADTIAKSFFAMEGHDQANFRAMMENPESMMDKPFVRYGRVMLITKYEGVLYYDFHGVRDAYEVFFYDNEKRLYTIMLPEIPPDLAVSQRATFAGYFLKRYAFRNRDGNATWTPFLVGYVQEVEHEKPKELTLNEKIFLGIFCCITVGVVIYLNVIFFRPRCRKDALKKANIEHAKNTRDLYKALTEKNLKLEELLISYYHQSFIEELPVPLELSQSITHWPENSEENKALLRPDYIKNEYEAILKHVKEFETDIPRDLKTSFFNKRKELLGLRSFQNSKFEIPDDVRKRADCILVIPLAFIRNKPQLPDDLNGFLDEYGLPPWNLWLKIGEIPKYIIRNSQAPFTPLVSVVVAYVPPWIAEKLKQHYRVIEKEKGTFASDGGESTSTTSS